MLLLGHTYSICPRLVRSSSSIAQFVRPRVPIAILSSTSRTPLPTSYSYSTASSPIADTNLKSVAVLGGGISGLSAVWYLAKFAPNVPVTLYEKAPRLGGWLNSKRVEYNGGNVLFEQGPRTLRPWSINSLATIDMIRQLGIVDDIVIIPKSSPAARNRFIYYPDQLNQLPNDVISTLLSFNKPVLKGAISVMFHEAFAKRRTTGVTDESVGSFMTRRLSAGFAQNLISAVLHGIYAGDIDRLSMRSLFPKQWRDEAAHGSMIRGMFAKKKIENYEDVMFRSEIYNANEAILEKIKNASVYSFKGGIETLSRALVKELEQHPNVTIKTSADLSGVSYKSGQFEITEPSTSSTYSHVISTLYAPTLNNLLPTNSRISQLGEIEASTVQVVNLYFKTPSLLPVKGFGYLLPKSLSAAQNPHNALGVIFDSDAMPDPSETGTKVTMMLGGHYWRGHTSYPDDNAAVANACELLKQHMNITEAPIATNVVLQRDCIPQYTIGHDDRMGAADQKLRELYGGRLSVGGSSYRGVGLNDCIRYVRDIVKGIVESKDKVYTGLEGMGKEPRWVCEKEMVESGEIVRPKTESKK